MQANTLVTNEWCRQGRLNCGPRSISKRILLHSYWAIARKMFARGIALPPKKEMALKGSMLFIAPDAIVTFLLGRESSSRSSRVQPRRAGTWP